MGALGEIGRSVIHTPDAWLKTNAEEKDSIRLDCVQQHVDFQNKSALRSRAVDIHLCSMKAFQTITAKLPDAKFDDATPYIVTIPNFGKWA